MHDHNLASYRLNSFVPDARSTTTSLLAMSVPVKIFVILILMRFLIACRPRTPPPDPQTKIKRIQNGPLADSTQASQALNEERDAFDKRIKESDTLVGPEPPEAQHPLGPFFAVSGIHDSLVENNQPHQTPSSLPALNGQPPSIEMDEIEHTMFGGIQEVSYLESPGRSTTFELASLIMSSKR